MESFGAILHFEQHLDVIISQHGSMVYVALFAIIFCETALLVLFFLPGDPLLFISGALCAAGAMDIWMLMGLLFAAAVIGNVVNYWLGNAVGSRVFVRDYRWLSRAALLRTHEFYERHGGITFLLSPFIAVVRTFAPFVAGMSTMTFRKFMIFTVAGNAIWVVTLVPGGYFFGNIPLVREHLNAVVLAGIAAGVGSLLLSGIWKHSKPRQVVADVGNINIER